MHLGGAHGTVERTLGTKRLRALANSWTHHRGGVHRVLENAVVHVLAITEVAGVGLETGLRSSHVVRGVLSRVSSLCFFKLFLLRDTFFASEKDVLFACLLSSLIFFAPETKNRTRLFGMFLPLFFFLPSLSFSHKSRVVPVLNGFLLRAALCRSSRETSDFTTFDDSDSENIVKRKKPTKHDHRDFRISMTVGKRKSPKTSKPVVRSNRKSSPTKSSPRARKHSPKKTSTRVEMRRASIPCIKDMTTPEAYEYLDASIENGLLREYLSGWLPNHPILSEDEARHVLGLQRKPRSQIEILRAYKTSKVDCVGEPKTLQELQNSANCIQKLDYVRLATITLLLQKSRR